MISLYVSGPMEDKLDDNWDAFHTASIALDDAGFLATIPHSLLRTADTREVDMLSRIHELTTRAYVNGGSIPFYDGLALLPGWEQSEGAKLEKAVAEACGITVKTVDEWIEDAS